MTSKLVSVGEITDLKTGDVAVVQHKAGYYVSGLADRTHADVWVDGTLVWKHNEGFYGDFLSFVDGWAIEYEPTQTAENPDRGITVASSTSDWVNDALLAIIKQQQEIIESLVSDR